MDHLVEHKFSIKPYHKRAIPVPLENEPVLGNNDHHCCQLQLVQTAGSKYGTQISVGKNRHGQVKIKKTTELELKQSSVPK